MTTDHAPELSVIEADCWPAPVGADASSIRAAIHAGQVVGYGELKISRQDGWELWGVHRKGAGWQIHSGTTKPRVSMVAARHGSKYAHKRPRSSLPWRLFDQIEHFAASDLEAIALEFIGGLPPPASVQWVELTK